MGINLHLENESGDCRQSISDDGFFVSELISASQNPDTVCLRFIDPYGDTVFNQSQLAYLKDEISRIPDSKLSQGARLHRDKLLNLLNQASGKVHTYLKFYGD